MEDLRYSRLEAITWWNAEAVGRAKALVVGCGALGNEVIKNLLLLGWGTIIAVDFDRVEMSNLTRSILFRPEDVGQPKATVVARVAKSVNPDCKVFGLFGHLELMISAGMVRRQDIVFGCLDNAAARLALARISGVADRLYIDGGLTPWEVSIRIFLPSTGGACYACGLTTVEMNGLTLRRSCPEYAARALTEGGLPTTPATASLAGAVMVQQALKWIHGRRSGKELPVSHELRFDTSFNRFWKVELPRNSDCVLHPQPIFVDDQPLYVGGTWNEILDFWKHRLKQSEVTLHLPAPVLLSWRCIDCGYEEQVIRSCRAEQNISCTRCNGRAIPHFINQILGSEEWLDRSPVQMGFPPWTWVRAYAKDEEWAFEVGDISNLGDLS